MSVPCIFVKFPTIQVVFPNAALQRKKKDITSSILSFIFTYFLDIFNIEITSDYRCNLDDKNVIEDILVENYIV